jgi:hypothetical protein
MDFQAYLKNRTNKELSSKQLIEYMFYETEKLSDIPQKWMYVLIYEKELDIRNMLTDGLRNAIDEEAAKIIGVDLHTTIAANYLYRIKYEK